jgi:hypothetical protein
MQKEIPQDAWRETNKEIKSGNIKLRTDKILEAMAETFRERNAKYGDNYQKVGKVMAVLFPDGMTLKTEADFIRWHFFDWAIGKLTRFVSADMKHQDSIHDCAVYLAMIEDYISQEANNATE